MQALNPELRYLVYPAVLKQCSNSGQTMTRMHRLIAFCDLMENGKAPCNGDCAFRIAVTAVHVCEARTNSIGFV